MRGIGRWHFDTGNCNTLGQYELPAGPAISAAVASFVSSTPANETISMVDGPATGGYPIVNYEYAIVRNSAQYLEGVQFQPLPASVVSLCDAQIAKIS